MIDLSGAVLSLMTGTYTVTRRTASDYGADGKVLPPDETTFTVQGSLQPISGRKMQMAPEGHQNNELRSFWTTEALHTVESPYGADTVTDGVDVYKVIECHAWDTQGKYWQTTLALLDP